MKNTEYIACVVPAFEAGRLAGLGGTPDVERSADSRMERRTERAGQRLAAGLLPLGISHRRAGRFRIDRRASCAARFRGHCRPASDGHQRPGFRRAADDAAEP